MSGISNYLRNKVLDHILGRTAWDSGSIPATLYVRLVKTTPTAAVAGTETTGTDYAPEAITNNNTKWSSTNGAGVTTNPSTGTTGECSNLADVDFGNAGAGGWSGPITNFELWDASSGGNRWGWGTIVDGDGNPAPRTVTSGDPVKFSPGTLRIGMS